ncbi:RHS repeat protein [Halochromatium glycolicum]|uniref:Teneurin-like YD-shell domain-containing protein n=1 Tax=Halochromatium glycolicum TaxID=85075 RepID=A0AAJ0U8Q0_9GAMM|nr:hypothetical protein [Halochromatium glycolicum]
MDGQRPTTTFTYTAQGQLATLTDAEGTVTRYEYDTASGDLTHVIEDSGGLALTTRYGYDAVGNRTQVTDPRGHQTIYEYDANRRLEQSQAPAPFNHITRYAYHDDGLLERVERETGDPLNPWQTTRFTYTASGQRETVTDAEGNVTTLDYDAFDRLSQVRDPEQRVSEYHYDAKGRLLEVVEGVGTLEETLTEQHGYTDDGLPASATDGRGHTTRYTYDGLDRLARTTYPDGSDEQFSYDDNSNLTQYRTRAGVLIDRAYDALDRVRLKQVPGETDVTYAYDRVGRTTRIGDGHGDFTYAYDTAGRLEHVRDPSARVVRYDYDASGNRTRLTYPDGAAVDYDYDALDRVERIRENATVLADYSHDPLSRRTRLEYANGTHTDYRYEPDSDLAEIAHQFNTSTLSLQYGYNRASQRTSAQIGDERFLWRPVVDQTLAYTANVLNQYTSVDGIEQSYDANGNLTGDGTRVYSYDAQNRLTAVATPTRAIRYDYDPMGRRAQKAVDGIETDYLYDGAQVLAEYDENGQRLRRFIYGPGIDQPVVMERGEARYYYHFDAQGSVIALSDAQGAVAEHYAYGPFGESRDTSALGNPYRYTGRRLEAEAGLYDYRLRVYSPTLGRFLQPDPIGYGDGMNLYAYVGNDPLNLVDPWGLAGIDSGFWSLDSLQSTLDLVGFVPGIGEPADLLNAAIYLGRGDTLSAALSGAAIVPVLGIGATAGKLTVKGAKAADSAKLSTKSAREAGDNVIHVTQDGVALPPGTKHKIPDNYVENPHRSGSYGEIVNGKYKEKLRIDPPTQPGKKGPNYSHYHKNGKGTHYSPRSGDSDPGF